MKILFCGGGSLGPVTPLVAVLRQMRRLHPSATFAWVGTPFGPEREIVEAEHVAFYSLPVAKIPRYLSPELLQFPWKFFQATQQAKKILDRERPNLVVSVGGFTAVPVMRTAARLGMHCALHQLDCQLGLSNKAAASLCESVTTSFAYACPPFTHSVATQQLPTPCRFAHAPISSPEEAKRSFGINSSRKVIFITGGGTGAMRLNEAVAAMLDELLPHADVIHSTGTGKRNTLLEDRGYHAFELLNEAQMLAAYTAADVVISRAGIGALSELAALKKAAIVIPIPGSQQEENAKALEKGIIWVNQTEIDFAHTLQSATLQLLNDAPRQAALGETLYKLLPTDDGTGLAERWLGLI